MGGENTISASSHTSMPPNSAYVVPGFGFLVNSKLETRDSRSETLHFALWSSCLFHVLVLVFSNTATNTDHETSRGFRKKLSPGILSCQIAKSETARPTSIS